MVFRLFAILFAFESFLEREFRCVCLIMVRDTLGFRVFLRSGLGSIYLVKLGLIILVRDGLSLLTEY